MVQAASRLPSHPADPFGQSSSSDDVLDRVERLHAHLAAIGAASTVEDVASVLASAARDVAKADCARVMLQDASAAARCDDVDCDVCGTDIHAGTAVHARSSWPLREGQLLLRNAGDDDVSNRLVAWLVEQAGLGLDRTRDSRSAAATVDALLRSERERTEMVEVLAHDLRSPMTALHGFASLLAQRWSELDEGRRRDLLAMIQRETGRMNRLVDDVTSAVLGPTTQLPLRLGPVDVPTVVHDLVVAAQASTRDHTIRCVIAPGAPQGVADEDRLSQIVSNLLENATRHTPSGTITVVHVGSQDGQVTVTVADDGPGIPAESRERIFDRGGRASDAPGTGLGLFNARQLAEAMGGSLTLEDSTAGARFVLRLPLPGLRAISS